MNKQRVLQALENVKSNPYGKWGILNIEQRRFIKEICDSWLILDDATNKQTEEIERLHSIIKEAREYIENNKEYTTIKKATKEWQYGKVKFEERDEDILDEDILDEDMIKELLKILDKEGK